MTKDDVANTTELESKLDKVSQSVTSLLDTLWFFMDSVGDKIDEYDREFRQLSKKHDYLMTTMDSFISKTDKYEVETGTAPIIPDGTPIGEFPTVAQNAKGTM